MTKVILPVEEIEARKGQARILARVRHIKRNFDELRNEALFMLEGDKWRLVSHFDVNTGERRNYKNAAEYLQLVCGIKQSTAYDWMKNALVEKVLVGDGLAQIGEVSTQALRELGFAAKTDEMRKGLYILASNAVGGTPTSGDIKRAVDVVANVIATGVIEVEEGQQVSLEFEALGGAVALEIAEAVKRHKGYIAGARTPRKTLFSGHLADSGMIIPPHIIARSNLEKVHVAIWEEIDDGRDGL